MPPPAASPPRIRTAPAAHRQSPGTAVSTRKQPPAPNRSPGSPAKSQPADANCRKPASDLLDVLQAVPARRHRSGTRPPAAASARPANNPPPTGWPQHRAAAGPGQMHPHSARHGNPKPAAAAGQRKPPADPPGGIFQDWSRP
jgi:hypothetical protein